MRGSSDHARGGEPAAPWRFASAIWLAIATILICALAPAGLPQSSAQGSAFSPSTTIVALKARADGPRLVIKRIARSDDDGHGGEAHAAMPLLAPANALAQLSRPALDGSGVAAPFSAFHLLAFRKAERPWPIGPPEHSL